MLAYRKNNGMYLQRNISHSLRGLPLISKQAKTARVLVASAAASAGSRPLHHIAVRPLLIKCLYRNLHVRMAMLGFPQACAIHTH